MMKNSFSIAVWMTLTSVIVKILFFYLEVDLQSSIKYVAFFNLLVISVGTFFGIRQYKISKGTPTLYKDEVKAGMRTVALYAVLMAVFVYVYYSYIDQSAFPSLIQDKIEVAKAAQEAGQQNIDLNQVEEFSTFIFSPQTHSSITLFGFLVAGAIYAMLMSYFMRKFPGFK